MRILRVISVLILVFGLFMSALGTALLLSIDRNTLLLEELQKAGMGQDIDAQKLRLIIIQNAIGFVIVGLVSLISGIGLLLRRNWSRILWLVVLAVFLSMNFYDLLLKSWYGALQSRDVVSFLVVLAITGAIGYYFLRAKTRLLFITQKTAGYVT
jgi:uncharacterized membrane protein (DUF2068 family)